MSMSWGEMAFAEPENKALDKAPPRRIRAPADALVKKPAIILDMGEASREQGFRLNGCR